MSEEGIRWGRVARGFYLVGIGTFLLLCTQQILPWSFWRDVVSYWPVFLVAIGIRLLFERSPFPVLVLLGPLLVLGTMMYVARRGPAGADAWQEWQALRAERPAGLSSWTLEGRLAMASLDVGARRLSRELLVEGRGTEAGSRSVRIAERTAPDRVRVTNAWSRGVFFVLPGAARARCELGVTPTLPVALDLDLAFTTTRLDIPTVPVKEASVQGAFNDLTLRLGAPSTDVRLRFEGAFNQVTIEVPTGTPVRASSEGLLNFVDERREDRGPGAGGAPG